MIWYFAFVVITATVISEFLAYRADQRYKTCLHNQKILERQNEIWDARLRRSRELEERTPSPWAQKKH